MSLLLDCRGHLSKTQVILPHMKVVELSPSGEGTGDGLPLVALWHSCSSPEVLEVLSQLNDSGAAGRVGKGWVSHGQARNGCPNPPEVTSPPAPRLWGEDGGSHPCYQDSCRVSVAVLLPGEEGGDVPNQLAVLGGRGAGNVSWVCALRDFLQQSRTCWGCWDGCVTPMGTWCKDIKM